MPKDRSTLQKRSIVVKISTVDFTLAVVEKILLCKALVRESVIFRVYVELTNVHVFVLHLLN